MSSRPSDAVARALGVASAARVHRIQSLWGGYGEAVRLSLSDGRTVVVKDVHPGPGSGRGHARKLRSYAVEAAFYRDFAPRCPVGCRVPVALAVEDAPDGWLFVLEDLVAAGFAPSRPLEPLLDWLACFHATFLGVRPDGLWPVGTYWHLDTRPDEHRSMAAGPLKQAAARLDAALSGARFQTLVHGDAKPANFLVGPAGAAAVDFQYVGGGIGVKDVAYLLSGEDPDVREDGLDRYFAALRAALSAEVDGAALEAEWRALYPLAWADFHRFLRGWAPHWTVRPDEEALTLDAIRSL